MIEVYVLYTLVWIMMVITGILFMFNHAYKKTFTKAPKKSHKFWQK
jgi:hypothetical protein